MSTASSSRTALSGGMVLSGPDESSDALLSLGCLDCALSTTSKNDGSRLVPCGPRPARPRPRLATVLRRFHCRSSVPPPLLATERQDVSVVSMSLRYCRYSQITGYRRSYWYCQCGCQVRLWQVRAKSCNRGQRCK